MFAALQTVNKANREYKLLPDEEFVPALTGKPENGLVYDSGTSTDEFEAMIQVMKGRPITRNTYGQAVQAIRKTQGTELYNQLTDRITGAKQRLEDALNAKYDKDDVDWNDSDVMKYVLN